ncbi:MAG: DUF2892 domain-containing protein [Alphaproteobacteria bacterium]|nr:DUF2892 domain-containing protein [Alphaproteobacteria bacterium]
MNANIGKIDRLARFALGLVALAFGLVSLGNPAWPVWSTTVLLIVGAVLIGTAAIRFCPAYRLVGVRTCQMPKSTS